MEECVERQKQTARPCGGTDPAPSRGERGAADTSMRTERITLEVTHDLDSRLSDWIVEVVDESLGLMESVRVVEGQ